MSPSQEVVLNSNNMNSLFWHKVKSTGPVPSPREGLTLLHCPQLLKWVLFGGTGDHRSNEVFLYDASSGAWELMVTEGHIPRARAYHVAWVDLRNDLLFIHGGQGEKRDSLGDMFVLDLKSFLWKKLYIIDQPSGRAYHAACLLEDKLFMYGGSSAPENLILDDLWSFSFRDIDWTASATEVPASGWALHRPKGNSPGPRKGHTLCSYLDTLILFGGVTNQKYSSDLFMLNTSELRWVQAHPRGKGPSPRAFHATTVLGNNCIAILGGVESFKEGRAERLNILNDFYILDLTELHWSAPIIGGYCPSRRYGHAMCWGTGLDNKEQLLLLGGLEQSYCLMESFSLAKTELGPGQAWQVVGAPKEEKVTLNRAEGTLQEQNKKIKDLQSQLSLSRDRIVILENEKQTLSQRLDQEYKKSQEAQHSLSAQIIALESQQRAKETEAKALKRTVDSQEAQNSRLREKTEKLEDLIKKAESLLITLDHSFNEIVSLNAARQLQGYSKERVQEIAERKKTHHEALIALRSFYENATAAAPSDLSSHDSLQDSLEGLGL